MSSLFRLQEWSFSTKCVAFAASTTLMPPLLLGAMGWYRPLAASPAIDHLIYLGAAAGAGVLALLVFRSFSQQAERIARLTAQLNTYTNSPASGAENGPASDEVNGAISKALTLFKSQEAKLVASTATMQNLTTSIEHMAAQVAKSATAAEHTATQAQQGSSTVHKTLQGIRAMHIQVQDTARRIQHLETHADEVSELGQRIADLADHTSVLALNVSVQALRVDPHGGNAVIGAAEVEQLADRTVSATQRIAHLVHTIQRETTEVVSALETRAAELSQWMEATSQAEQVLQAIQQSADQLTSLIHATSQAVTQQANSSAELSKAMDEISMVTQQTTAWTKQAAASMSNLTMLAGSLHTSVHGQRAA